MDESRIHLLGSNGNGRPPLTRSRGYITVEQAEAMCVKVAEHYANQVPNLINAALLHYGLITIAPAPEQVADAAPTVPQLVADEPSSPDASGNPVDVEASAAAILSEPPETGAA